MESTNLNSSLSRLLNTQIDYAQDCRLLRYLLFGLIALRIIGIAIQPKRWQLIGLASLNLGVGWIMLQLLDGTGFLTEPKLWQIMVNQLDFYAFTIWHGFVGAAVSGIMVAITQHLTPAHDPHWYHWVRDWLCIWLIVSMIFVIISGTTCDCQRTVELGF